MDEALYQLYLGSQNRRAEVAAIGDMDRADKMQGQGPRGDHKWEEGHKEI